MFSIAKFLNSDCTLIYKRTLELTLTLVEKGIYEFQILHKCSSLMIIVNLRYCFHLKMTLSQKTPSFQKDEKLLCLELTSTTCLTFPSRKKFAYGRVNLYSHQNHKTLKNRTLTPDKQLLTALHWFGNGARLGGFPSVCASVEGTLININFTSLLNPRREFSKILIHPPSRHFNRLRTAK